MEINKYFKPEPFIKSIKELGRIGALATIPVMIDGLTQGMISWKLIGITAVIAVLKAVDKYLHTLGKEINNKKLITGLTRF